VNDSSTAAPRWHQALGFALTGERHPQWPEPRRLDVDSVLAALGGIDEVREHAEQVIGAHQPWPHRVPEDLRTGLGMAQWSALMILLETRVHPARGTGAPPVPPSRALTPAEVRLMRDVPPHHGV